MNRQEKELQVQELTDRFKKAKALIFADFRKMKVSEMTGLRSELRKAESILKVVKNRLAKRVLSSEGIAGLDGYFDGPTAVASSEAEPASVAKILVEFSKSHEALKIKGGFFEGKAIGLNEINVLAKLPSREVLYSKMLATMLAPATGLACVLSAVPQKLVRVLDAIKKTKE